jgi:hypothetical protein
MSRATSPPSTWMFLTDLGDEVFIGIRIDDLCRQCGLDVFYSDAHGFSGCDAQSLAQIGTLAGGKWQLPPARSGSSAGKMLFFPYTKRFFDHDPQAVRHHRPALRQRRLPHRPHDGIHPGRHLGPLPANAARWRCAARGALRRRRRHPRHADHDRGREGRHHAAGIRGQDRRRPRRSTWTASTSPSTTGIRPIRRKTSSCRRASTASCATPA